MFAAFHTKLTVVCSQILISYLEGVTLEWNTPVAPKNTDSHMTEAHISQNDYWETAPQRKRKASDKLFKLKCFHMVIPMQWLLKNSTSVFKIASPPRASWNKVLKEWPLLTAKWSTFESPMCDYCGFIAVLSPLF